MLGSRKNGVAPDWIENPQGKMDVPNGNWAHLTGCCGAIWTQASRTVSANGTPKHHKIVSVPCLWAEVATLKFNPDLGR